MKSFKCNFTMFFLSRPRRVTMADYHNYRRSFWRNRPLPSLGDPYSGLNPPPPPPGRWSLVILIPGWNPPPPPPLREVILIPGWSLFRDLLYVYVLLLSSLLPLFPSSFLLLFLCPRLLFFISLSQILRSIFAFSSPFFLHRLFVISKTRK